MNTSCFEAFKWSRCNPSQAYPGSAMQTADRGKSALLISDKTHDASVKHACVTGLAHGEPAGLVWGKQPPRKEALGASQESEAALGCHRSCLAPPGGWTGAAASPPLGGVLLLQPAWGESLVRPSGKTWGTVQALLSC